MALPDQQEAGREWDGTAGREQTAVTDLHQALGPDMLEESPETRDGVEMGRPGADTAPVPGGESDGTVLEAPDAAGGEGDREDGRGAGGEGGGAMVIGLTVDVPGEGPDHRS